MHMADALLSASVGGAMCAAAAAAIGYSAVKIRKEELFDKKAPLMAVCGAFVFAAQMINFTIPGTGSSGHIGGGVLLASLLGGGPALLTIAAVLIIQCLFFADGGLLALGCNIVNMGVIPCLLVYPFIIKPILKRKLSPASISIAAVVGSVLSLQLGAFAVVLETQASGVTQLPFAAFALLMQPIHLAIGAIEGVITAAILCFVHQTRPELLAGKAAVSAKAMPIGRIIIIFAVAAALVGGALSLFASTKPDGLEWAAEKVTEGAELTHVDQVSENAANVQERIAFWPDYDFRGADGEGSAVGTSFSGLVGGALTFVLAGGTALAISMVKNRRKHGIVNENAR